MRPPKAVPTKGYQAEDSDLPPIFGEPIRSNISPVASAKLLIHDVAQTLNIEISRDELEKFAVLYIALHQD